jgi:purine-binding chemotaxis protein CheW
MTTAKANEAGRPLGRSSDGPLSRWVGFSVAQQHYALDILRVQEVLAGAEIEPVPGAPAAVLGVINLRGRIITAIDLGRCLGFNSGPLRPPYCVIVVDVPGETLGLRVDGVAEICSVSQGAIRPPPPTLGRTPDPLVRGIVARGGQMLTLLDAERLAQVAARS